MSLIHPIELGMEVMMIDRLIVASLSKELGILALQAWRGPWFLKSASTEDAWVYGYK